MFSICKRGKFLIIVSFETVIELLKSIRKLNEIVVKSNILEPD
jgi:hypothetical protein